MTWDDFVAIVERYFAYLETEFGFKRVLTNEPFVSYESHRLRINIYWECSRTYELDLRMRPLVKIERPFLSFGIGNLMRLRDPKATHPAPFPKTREEVETGVREYAELLREYGSNVLRGDLHDLVRIVELNKEAAKKMSRQNRVE